MITISERRAPSIFISYRIADTLQIADRLAAELQRTFGADEVFFDRRTIEPGDSWDGRIETAVKGAAIVLVLIGRKWLTEQDQYGSRRLDAPGDWVRREVEEALVNKTRVVPLLVDDASPPPGEAFARVPSIVPLSSCQGARLRTTDWDKDFSALVDLLVLRGLCALTKAEVGRSIIPGRLPTRGGTAFVGRSDELDDVRRRLPPIGTAGVVVIRGTPGVGKSELAREYARRHQADYHNGAFFIGMRQTKVPVELVTHGSRNLGLNPGHLTIEDQCSFVLRHLGASTLLIYDNVADPDAVAPWLPADDEATHVLITTTWEDWPEWDDVEVKPLGERHALDVVEALGGPDVTKRFGTALVAKAGGLPVQLCPATRSIAKALRRHGDVQIAISAAARASFADVWTRLEPAGRLLLAAAAMFNPDRIRADWLRSRMAEAAGWTAASVDAALNACMDLSLLDAGEDLRMHRLLQEFARATSGADASQLVHFRELHSAAFLEAAKGVGDSPTNAAVIAELMCYALDPTHWSLQGNALAMPTEDFHEIGYALTQIGLFAEARLWFARAVEEAEKGDVHGRVDHASLGRSLHQVGVCLSETGDYKSAKDWFARAVEEAEKGDVHGRADHESLGVSLHQVGLCLSASGDHKSAKDWFARAVEEKKEGDVHGRVDHASLGRSLHQVGVCLSETGDYKSAKDWFERAVEEKKKGDAHGRADHESLGRSLHQVGVCLSETGDYKSAKDWFERAVEEKRKGDVHGRVDHESLGVSLHQVGVSLSATGDHKSAKDWFARAVEQAEKGDVHGRIDHASLGRSLHQVGLCLSETGDYKSAKDWFERAVEEKKKGDVYGRVDQASVELSKRALSAPRA